MLILGELKMQEELVDLEHLAHKQIIREIVVAPVTMHRQDIITFIQNKKVQAFQVQITQVTL